jgi:aminodeoxyfutalosine synthase
MPAPRAARQTNTMNPTLQDIQDKLAAGEPLARSDADALAATPDIVALGMLADGVRRARHGRRTTFVRVAHVALADAATGSTTWPAAAGELRLDGAFEDIYEAVSALSHLSAAGVTVTAFSLEGIVERAGGDLALVTEWLARLKDAGLSALASAAIDRLPAPTDAAAAVSRSGLAVRAWTVAGADRGDLLAPLRAVQALAGTGHAVRVFAPIPRQQAPEPTTGYADVKSVALARVLLDVPHVQVDWALHGPKLAQVALTFGADDVDDVSAMEESVEGRRRAPLEEIRRNILAAGLEPVERDGRFAPVA